MVVLSAAIIKKDKTLVARQFVEMTRLRIEGLLGAFTKLVDSGKDHTFRTEGEGNPHLKSSVFEVFSEVSSLTQLGPILWWLILRAAPEDRAGLVSQAPSQAKSAVAALGQDPQVTRKARALFPLPHNGGKSLDKFPNFNSLGEVFAKVDNLVPFSSACWADLAAGFCNHLHNRIFSWSDERPTETQKRMLEAIQLGVDRMLAEDCNLEWHMDDVRADLSKKLVSYTGEEVSKPEMLTPEQVIPGLPPADHGGRIPVREWVGGRCQWYLDNPTACLLEDTGQELPKLSAKVHIAPQHRLELAKLLIERRICRWVFEEDILRFRGQEVLNGLFGVEKSKKLSDQRPVLRLIMNLIPSNSVHRIIHGRVGQLPHITKWTSIVLEDQEILQVCQSDMASAFYLFSLPPSWSNQLVFNLKFKGEEVGFTGEEAKRTVALACSVLPMGWASAVGVMQYVAEEVLYRNGMTQLGKFELKQERLARRKGIALEDRALAPSTRVRYYLAVRQVLPILERHPHSIDSRLSQWIEQRYLEGEAITGVGDALCGLHHFAPWTRGEIRSSWRLFRLWRRIEKPQQSPPLPEPFVEAMVGKCLEDADLDMAVALAMGFWGLLRTGEILQLTPAQILLGHSDIIIQLGLTKTGQRRQQDENVIVLHRGVWYLVQTFLQIRRQQRTMHLPIILGGGPQFRSQFAALTKFFTWSTPFRPYSLRRGGATADFRAFHSMERTLIKGRWGTSFAARQYIQEGLSVLTTIKLAPHQSQQIHKFARNFVPSTSPADWGQARDRGKKSFDE
eukprot:Skav224260  [mRNA]  locus=scaffold2636:134039:145536:- [translate_table: standard]